MGPGFLEAVYQAALKIEFTRRSIPFTSEQSLDIFYKGEDLGLQYRADFVCFGQIIVELKALDRLSGKEESQIIHYLKATEKRAGLLINFGSSGVLEWKKFVH
ncbi:MAG: GxxExxY protein [Acidobacteria bacterium]|nr:GxxExxY protein [Acidobacteriota bacterium]